MLDSPAGGLSGAVTSLCTSKRAGNWLRTSGRLRYSLCSLIQCLDTFPHATGVVVIKLLLDALLVFVLASPMPLFNFPRALQ